MGALHGPARQGLAIGLAGVLAVGGLVGWRVTHHGGVDAPGYREMADRLGAEVMTDVVRGYVPGRSGDVVLVPRPHWFVLTDEDQCGLVGGPPAVATTHAGPWSYLARVPLAFYGPGLIPSGRTVYDPATLASIAPTYARLLGMRGFEADALPLHAVVRDAASRPKAIVTVLLDGGGWDVLQSHPGAWPVMQSLFRHGTLYANASNGSSPSITGAIMATIGTGRYPRTHGIPGNQMRGPTGAPVDTWNDDGDPGFLRVPTAGDDYERATGNRSIQALIGAEGWHLGLLGRGSYGGSGERQLAAWWDRDSAHWVTNAKYYTMPPRLGGLDAARLAGYDRSLDGADGVLDGRWFGHSPASLADPEVRPATPSFARLEFDAAIRVVDGAGFGRDRTTDLLAIEAESPDQAGHVWGSTSPEEESVLSEVDRGVGRLIRALDRRVGRGNYVVTFTADHGQEMLPETTGGWRINGQEVKRDLVARFGPVVKRVAASEIYLDHGAMSRAGLTADDVARFLGGYTVRDATPARRLSSVPPARLDETVFAAVFPGAFLARLTPAAIAGFGRSSYAEGVLTMTAPPGDLG